MPRERAGGREAMGVGLLAAALLLLLALFSSGPGVGEGNLIGPAGEFLDRVLGIAFGEASLLLAVPVVAWALYGFGALSTSAALRWSLLGLGALVLLPTAVALLDAVPPQEAERTLGWVGRHAAGVLVAGFGEAGAGVIVVALLGVLLVTTVGWSPAEAAAAVGRAAGRGASLAAEGGRRLGRAAADAVRRRRGSGRGDGASGEESPWARRPEGDGEEARTVAAEGEERASGRHEAPEEESTEWLADPGDLSQTELPSLDLLRRPDEPGTGLSEPELEELGGAVVDKLETFGVEGRISGWTTGPVVTQFEVVPAPGVKVGQIAALSDDLALALKAPSVRIVAPIPGKGAVGVEVPNPEPEVVYLREILESARYRRSRATLPLALGRDLSGDPYCADLTRMPHLLIAGATGSGKSVCIHTIITSLLYRYTPRRLRLLLIDPKMVELSVYDELPHLRHPVVTDNEEAATVLRWTVHEMNRRYALLSANACRNLDEFNRRVEEEGELRDPEHPGGEPYAAGEIPYVVLIIDELADLIMTVQSQVESPLAMLAQKARAVGIHLVVATQRPSVNVITGLIKANFPSRIAFRVASKTDSRTILDQNGAESLLGNGDMLFLPPGESDPSRIQGAFVGSEDTERLVTWFRRRAEARGEEVAAWRERDILEVVEEKEAEEARVDVVEEVLEDRDELFRQAAELVITHDSGSTSLLQRRLKIGYGRAARIIDQLHHAGIVGPSQGSQAREVLVTLDELEDVLEEEAEAG